jgi:hypothetical protein
MGDSQNKNWDENLWDLLVKEVDINHDQQVAPIYSFKYR